MKWFRILSYAFLGCAGGLAWAGQQNAPAMPATPTASSATAAAASTSDPKPVLKERINAYYTAVINGDKTAAAQFVVPDSRSQFEKADFRSLVSFTVEQIAVDPSGAKADVTVTRSFMAPFAITLPLHDQWTNIDGQWYLALPKADQETPFGRLQPNPNAPPPDPEMARRMAERRTQTVDSDQYVLQMQKYMKEHPNALPPVEMQVPIPQTQISLQGDPKPAATGNAASAKTSEKDSKKDGKKKKDTKKTKQQPETTKQ